MQVFKNYFLVKIFIALLIVSVSSAVLAKERYSELLCEMEGFTCLKIKKKQTWESLWPDKDQRQLIMKLNRVNIKLHKGMIVAVPNDLSKTDIMDYSPFPQQIDPTLEKVIIFNPHARAWGAYNALGQLVRWGPASGGSLWCRDIKRPCKTGVGEFRVFAKRGADCISSKYPLPKGGAKMPYCVFFHDGEAFHGAPSNLPGYNASHGCVRLLLDDAKWLNQDFVELPSKANQNKGTRVIIQPYPPKAEAAKK